MIVPHRLVFLVLLAVATFNIVAASTTARLGKPSARNGAHGKGHVARWQRQLERQASELLQKAKAAARNPDFGTTDVVLETNKYLPAVRYQWPEEQQCSGNALSATYYGTGCVNIAGGISSRYICVIKGTDPSTGKLMGELQLHGFANDDCKSAPGFVSVVEEFVVGDCDSGARFECSTDLQHGLEDAVAFATYIDDKCTTLYPAAYLFANGCNGQHMDAHCDDGELIRQAFINADCTGMLTWKDSQPVGLCQQTEHDDDNHDGDDDAVELTVYHMQHCSPEGIIGGSSRNATSHMP